MSFIPVGIGKSLSGATLSGSVLFTGTNRDLQSDNNNLHWDGTNQRLGIGVSAPSVVLEVAGQIKSDSGGFVFPDGSIQTVAAGAGSSDPLTINRGITANAGTFTYLRANSENIDTSTVNLGITTNAITVTGLLNVSGGVPLTTGAPVSGGGANRILLESGTQNLTTFAGFTYDGTNLAIPISGGIKFGSNIYIDYSNPLSTVYFGDFNNNGVQVSIVGKQTNPDIRITNGLTDQWRFYNGNLGSGPGFPGSTLDVQGNANVQTGITTNAITLTTLGGGITFPDNTVQTTAASGGSDPLTINKGITTNAITTTTLSVGANPALSVDANQAVHINTPLTVAASSTFSSFLTVNSTATFSAAVTASNTVNITGQKFSVTTPVATFNGATFSQGISTNAGTFTFLRANTDNIDTETINFGLTANAGTFTFLRATTESVDTLTSQVTSTFHGTVTGDASVTLTGAVNVQNSLQANTFAAGPDGTTLTSFTRDAEYSFTIDGGSGSLLAVSQKNAYARVKANFTATSWELGVVGINGVTGFVLLDILKGTAPNNFPPRTSITGSLKPVSTAGFFNNSSNLSGWTTAWNKGDYIDVSVLGATSVSKAILTVVGTERSYL